MSYVWPIHVDTMLNLACTNVMHKPSILLYTHLNIYLDSMIIWYGVSYADDFTHKHMTHVCSSLAFANLYTSPPFFGLHHTTFTHLKYTWSVLSSHVKCITCVHARRVHYITAYHYTIYIYIYLLVFILYDEIKTPKQANQPTASDNMYTRFIFICELNVCVVNLREVCVLCYAGWGIPQISRCWAAAADTVAMQSHAYYHTVPSLLRLRFDQLLFG